jgi:hypothetical protein
MTISATTPNQIYAAALNPTQEKPAHQNSQKVAQDSVELSAQAKAALDVDHDGDSH